MMNFEPVVERAAVHCAASITVDDMTSEFPTHGPRPASQVERFALLGEADQVDIAVADDFFEDSRTETWSSQN
jgi:hypothetical protein